MEEEIQKTNTQAIARIHVFATSGDEMSRASGDLSEWFSHRINQEKAELSQLEKNLSIAKKQKWNTQSWRSAISKLNQRVSYYQKAKAAVDAGYTIIPDLNAEWFAVRTSREVPPENAQDDLRYEPTPTRLDLPAEPMGEGETVSSLAFGRYKEYKNEKGETRYRSWDTDFQEVSFPVRFVRPEIVEATAEAIKLKIFDAFGLVGGRRKDPLIVGLIKGPKEGWTRRQLHFVVGWFLDTRSL